MNCSGFQKKTGLLVSGECTPGQEAELRAHAQSCSGCAGLLAAEEKLDADLSVLGGSGTDEKQKVHVTDIMNAVRDLPLPGLPQRETSMLFRIFYTLYNSVAVGIMFAAIFIMGRFVSVEGLQYLPEVRDALFGGLCIIIGGILIVLQGRELTLWFAARVKQLTTFQIAPDSIFMFAAGLCFWITGTILLFNGIFQ
jgi:hypothetical protein